MQKRICKVNSWCKIKQSVRCSLEMAKFKTQETGVLRIYSEERGNENIWYRQYLTFIIWKYRI
jgi:hypothetical protein